jgi:DNA-binding PadR family transcriptional regulator
VRSAVLLLLAEQPRHGYDVISEIAARSEGQWRPSAGSVYPVLAALEAEGLVSVTEDGDRKVYRLTEAGEQYVAARREEFGTPWQVSRGHDRAVVGDLLEAARDAAAAVWQVGQVGDDEQLAEAVEVLAETRRRLYRILAREQA